MKNKYSQKLNRLAFTTGLIMSCFSQTLMSQVFNTQSFDGATFPPAGWANTQTSGTGLWTRVTSGTQPTQTNHSGAGEAEFNCYGYSSGTAAILVTPAYDLRSVGTNTATVSFWMYRDATAAMNTYTDKVDLYENTSPSVGGATLLGTVFRATNMAPVVGAQGWYQYTYNVPAGFNTGSNYFILQATSNFGDNIFIDDVAWTAYPCLVAGGTASSSSILCTGSTTSLSLSGQDAAGTLQWQSSPNNSTWTNIPGATSSSYTSGALSSTTYFRCAVTNGCTNYSNVVTTTIVQAISGTATGPSTVCTGSTATLTLTGNSGTIQWQSSPDNITWTNIPGATATPYTTAAINSPIYYRAKVSNSPCADVFSNVLHVTLNFIPLTPGNIYGSTMPCIGSTTTYSVATVGGATTYNWTAPLGSNIQTGTGTNIITVLIGASSGAISVSAGNTCGTSPTNSITIIPQSSAPAAPGAISGPTTICSGSTGNYSVAAVANTAYYKWAVPAGASVSAGQGTNSISILWGSTSGNVTVKDSSGCGISTAATLSVTVNPSVTPSLAIALSSGSNPSCAGSSVTFSASPTNGGATPVYQWKVNGSNVGTNSTTFTSTTLANGQVVSCALTSNASCASPATVSSNSITMTVNPMVTPSISTSITSGSNPMCAGSSITFSASPVNGGTTPAYQWQVNGTNAGTNSSSYTNAAISNGQSVTCILTSNASCATVSTATSTATTMTVNAIPATPAPSSNGPVCSGTALNLFSNATANAYSWNGPNSFVSSSQNPSTANVSSSDAGTYSLSVTQNGCTSSIGTINVVVNATPTVTVNNATICSGQTATLTVNGASSYNWSSGGSSNNESVNPASTTSYTVTGTSGGCSASAVATVTVNTTPSVTVNNATICSGQTATLTANGASSYNWSSGGSSNIENVNPGSTTSYTVTGTSGGCSASAVATVIVNPTPSVTVNNATICSGQTATLTANGAASYNWSSGGSSNIENVNPGSTTSYTVTGTSGGCSASAVATVTVNTTPSITVNNATICSGQTATLTANGASSYNWSSGGSSNTESVNPTSTTSYTVTGTTNGCSASSVATVTVNSTPSVTVNDAVICSGQTATLTANGASSYNWSGGGTSNIENVNPTSTTSYTVTGTSGGCNASAIATVTVNASPNVTANATQTVVCNGANITLTGGGAATYAWSGGISDGVSFTPSSSQTYTVTGTDGNSCTNTAMITITVNSIPVVTANASNTNICNGDTITLSGSGATSYVWSNGVNNGIAFNPTATQTYTVTGSDSNGCSDSDTITVTVNSCSAGNNLLAAKTETILFPNPTSGNIVIKSSVVLGVLKIYNSMGELVGEEKVSGNEKQIDLSKQTPGIYFFEVQGKFIKVIKE
jgi:hypothetical protein